MGRGREEVSEDDMKSWVSEIKMPQHGLRYRAIARTFEQGYKGNRICKEYGISMETLEAILVVYGGKSNLRDARMWIRRRDANGRKKKTRQRRTDSIQSAASDGKVD